LRVVDPKKQQHPTNPRANIPAVLFPAAAPLYAGTLAEVAIELAQFEYVYLFRVDTRQGVAPMAKIPTVEFPVPDA
jgi:hypothetical protein